MKPSTNLFVFLTITSLLLLLLTSSPAESATCNVAELQLCFGPIMSGRATEACCVKLREQRPCLCQYIRDPNYKPYVDTPNARNVAAACKVTYPNC